MGLGFSQAGDWRPNAIAGVAVDAYLRVFVGRDAAISAVVLCPVTRGRAGSVVVSYCSDFEDGTSVETVNSSEPYLLKHVPDKVYKAWPKAALADLLAFHLSQVETFAAGKAPRPMPHDVAAEVIEDMIREVSFQEQCHLMKKTRSGEYYRYTLYGAIRAVVIAWLKAILHVDRDVVKVKAKDIAQYRATPTIPPPVAARDSQDAEVQQELDATDPDWQWVDESLAEPSIHEPVAISGQQDVGLPDAAPGIQSPPVPTAANLSEPEGYLLTNDEREKLTKQFMGGASWFYWIAGMSLINSFLFLFSDSESGFAFALGLGITQVIDGAAAEVAKAATGAGGVARVIALVFDITIAACFILFGIFATRKHRWAFVTGIILYSLDSLLLLGLTLVEPGILMALVIHAVGLYYIVRGIRAARKLDRITEQAISRPEPVTEPELI